MARETTGMGLRDFAEHIGVSPDTLTSAEKDRRKVRPITIRAYALATGVNRAWLETGEGTPPTTPQGPGGTSQNDHLARLTKQKQARTRRAGTTHGYRPRFAPAARRLTPALMSAA
jgi:DNA-binding XRE family transcriptional regulator